MGYNQSLTDLDQHAVVIKTQLAVLAIVLCLAVDTINPVKIFMHVFPQIVPWHIATLCVSIMVYIFVSELKTLLYFAVKVFFHSILSIFFKDVEVVGLQNVPRYGPVIFTGNHANQFIDGMSMLCTCQRTISYLVAEKSWNRPVVGHLSWALGTVPVKRAQDSARRGKGTVKLSGDSHGETQGPEEEGDSTKAKASKTDGFEMFYPRFEYCTDNGAMIAYAGCMRLCAGETTPIDSKVMPRWSLETLSAL
jgi:hypothetical protein